MGAAIGWALGMTVIAPPSELLVSPCEKEMKLLATEPQHLVVVMQFSLPEVRQLTNLQIFT